MTTLWIGLGGAVGSIARFHTGQLFERRFGAGYPYGTLVVNLLGSFLLVLLIEVALRTGRVPDGVRLALASGVLGGFTTYSSFNAEAIAIAEAGDWGKAAAYVGVTLGGCLIAGVAGWGLGRAVT
jgi:fluoride exporter